MWLWCPKSDVTLHFQHFIPQLTTFWQHYEFNISLYFNLMCIYVIIDCTNATPRRSSRKCTMIAFHSLCKVYLILEERDYWATHRPWASQLGVPTIRLPAVICSTITFIYNSKQLVSVTIYIDSCKWFVMNCSCYDNGHLAMLTGLSKDLLNKPVLGTVHFRMVVQWQMANHKR